MDLLLRDVGRSTVLRDGSLPELAFAAVASERLHWAASYLEDALKSSGALSKRGAIQVCLLERPLPQSPVN